MPGNYNTLRSSLFLLMLGGGACSSPPPEVNAGSIGSFTDSGTTMGGTTGTDSADTSGTDGNVDGTGPMFEAVCGNGMIEEGEECDLGEQNNMGGYCTEDCLENVCGDGYVGPGEACDDGNQNNGDLCTSDCGPTTCGDGEINTGEECDEGKNNSETGSCLPSCIEASCGDLNIESGVEACDGTNTGTDTCQSEGFDNGVLACAADCMTLDTSNCHTCGNSIIEVNEICDTDQFDGDTCESLGPGAPITVSGGSLDCIENCMTIDIGPCAYCPDGSREGPGEECDTLDFGGASCADYGMGMGTPNGMLSCTNACIIDSSDCTFCGDMVLETPAEQCEGMNLDNQSCSDFGFNHGELACMANCTFDATDCTMCGNMIREGSEECDDMDFGASTCETEEGMGFAGTLTCDNSCDIDSSDCCIPIGQPCTSDGQCCSTNCDDGNTDMCIPM